MAELILDTLREAWTNYLHAIRAFLPRVLATLSIIAAGWLLALALAAITRKVLAWLRFDALAERTGTADLLRKAELPAAHRVAGSVVFWVVLVGFLISGIDALGFRGMEGLMVDFVHFIPQLVVGVVVLVAGLLVANFVWRATLIAAVNAKLSSARLIAGAVRVLLIVLTATMALEQIGVARTVVITAFAIAFGAIMLAGSIAFGIAGGGIARRILEEQLARRPPGERDGISHL